MPSAVKTFTPQGLNEDSEIDGIAGVVASARTYVSGMDAMPTIRKMVKWDALEGLPATQSFLEHVVPFQ